MGFMVILFGILNFLALSALFLSYIYMPVHPFERDRCAKEVVFYVAILVLSTSCLMYSAMDDARYYKAKVHPEVVQVEKEIE